MVGQFRRERRISISLTHVRIVERKILHKFICPNCVSSTKRENGLYCKYFKNYITAKIISCPKFRSRLLRLFGV